ncbi:MAG TPA: hypothetical protein VHO46_03455 [Bacteroidales bacterium]|nr:hypothetical protein [Bacteroidales bacterium]
MKKVFAGFIVTLLITGVAGLTSCRNRVDKAQKATEEQQVNQISSEIQENVYPLPTSAQIIKLLTDLEVGYQIGITNPVDNVKKYFSSQRRAINLGTYGADLSYVTLYNMPQEVIDYLNAIRSLTNELNMAKIYNEQIYDSIKANEDNKEKLVDILTGTFNDTYKYLSDNNQQSLALLVVGGAWVEGMYLTTGISEAAYNVSTISGVLLEQKKSFERYIEITEPYMSDPGVSEFVKMLEPVKNVYAGLSTSLNDKDIADIKKAIEGIRTQMVQ